MIQQLPRRERERQMRRQEIINAARTVFAEKGFNEAKLEDVAERAEYGKGTLYNYFENKDALFACVLQDCFDTIRAIAEESLNAEVPFPEKIERFVRGGLGFFFHNPESMHLMMREAHYLRGGNPMMHLLPQLLSMLVDTIAVEQKRRTVIAHAEPIELATILINMLFGQFTARIYQRIICQPNAMKESAGDCAVSALFQGMGEAEIEREIAAATKLICTVYFTGITKS